MRWARLRGNYLGVIAVASLSASPKLGADVSLETTTFAAAAAIASHADGAVALPRDGYVEEIKPLANGWEQSFRFAAEPAGEGPLHLSIHPSGLSYLGTKGAWMHFASADTQHPAREYRYGDATWVDRDGVATNVQMTFAGGELGLDVPRSVLRASAYPAVLDPTMEYLAGDEQAFSDLDANSSDNARSAIVASPLAAAFGAGELVVVWGDTRNDGLYGARVDASGKSLDPVGVPLVANLSVASIDGLYNGRLPAALASDGNANVLLASAGIDAAHIVRASPLTLTGAALSLANKGYVLGSGESVVTAGPVAAWDGKEFLVAWASDQVRLTRVDPLRGSLDFVDTSFNAARPSSLAVACQPDASQCLLAWDGPTIVRFVPGGAVVDPTALYVGPSSMTFSGVAVAWDSVDQMYIVSWDDPTAGGRSARSILPQPAAALGPLAAWPLGAEASCGAAGCFFTHVKPALTTAGGSFLALSSLLPTLAYSDGTAIDCADAVVPTPTIVAGSLILSAAYCMNDNNVLGNADPTIVAGAVVQSKIGKAALGDVYDVGPSQLTPVLAVSRGASRATTASVAWTGPLVSSNVQEMAQAVVGTQAVSPVTGAALDSPLPAALVGTGGLSSIPTTYFAEPDGSFICAGEAASGFTISVPGEDEANPFAVNPGPTAALSSGDIVVASVVGGTVNASYIAALTTVRGVIDLTPNNVGGLPSSVALASSTNDVLIAWESFGATSVGSTTSAALLSPDDFSTTTNPSFSVIALAPGTSDSHSAPSVASGDGRFLVVWENHGDPATGVDIHGRFVSSSGQVDGAEIVIENVAGDQTLPVAAYLGGGTFAVAWQDARAVTTTGLDIYGAIVRGDGTVGYPTWQATSSANATNGHAQPLSNTSEDEHTPSLAGTGNQSLLVAYSRIDATLGVERIFVRAVTGGQPQSSGCTSNNECASLFCSDGVCCDAACDGACQECKIHAGTCTPVVSTADADHCAGTCSASGKCETALGQMCTTDAACISGHCASGVCCESACTGGCESCQAGTGACNLLAKGSQGVVSTATSGPASGLGECYPYLCSGTATCPVVCASDTDCVRPYICADDHTCKVLSGTTCADDHTVEDPNGKTTDCAPYACNSSMCLTSCASIEHCAPGSVCDATNHCVAAGGAPASPTDGGCSVGSARATSANDAFGEVGALALLVGLARRRRRDRPRAISL